MLGEDELHGSAFQMEPQSERAVEAADSAGHVGAPELPEGPERLSRYQLIEAGEEWQRRAEALKQSFREMHDEPVTDPVTLPVDKYPLLWRELLLTVPTIGSSDVPVTARYHRQRFKDKLSITWKGKKEQDTNGFMQIDLIPFPESPPGELLILDAAPIFTTQLQRGDTASEAARGEAIGFCRNEINKRSKFWQFGLLDELVELMNTGGASTQQGLGSGKVL